jgi:hypothetical protein
MFTGRGAQVRMPNGTIETMVESSDQVASLMIIFGIGYVAVFSVFVLLYWHALRQKDRLELNELEVFDTRTDIRESALNVGIAATSIAIAVFLRNASLSGMTYMLTPVVMTLHGKLNGRRRKKLEQRLGFSESPMFEPTT